MYKNAKLNKSFSRIVPPLQIYNSSVYNLAALADIICYTFILQCIQLGQYGTS